MRLIIENRHGVTVLESENEAEIARALEAIERWRRERTDPLVRLGYGRVEDQAL